MNNDSKFRLVRLLIIPAIVAAFLSITSCESSRTAPEVPVYTAPPAAAPLVLKGYVKDADNQTAIASAVVTVSKLDGSGVTNLLSDNSGIYTYDVSNVDATQLKITATKSLYGFVSTVADINKSENSAIVGDILLKQITGTSTTATAASGGTTSTASTESKSTTPATVNVPPGAVNTNTTVTLAPVPINQAPPKTTTQSPSLTVVNLEPSGITFNVPVTVVLPLPTKLTPGKVLSLNVFNSSSGQWESSGFNATVSADGYSATGQVTHFSTWDVTDPVITISQGTPQDGSASEVWNTTVTDTATKTASHSVSFANTFAAGTVSSGEGFSEGYMKNTSSTLHNVNFGSLSETITANRPALPAGNTKVVNGVTVQYNSATNSTNGKWNWHVSIVKTERTFTDTFTNSQGTQTATAKKQRFTIVNTWVWQELHNQGGG